MKILYLILVIIFYIIGVILGLNQKINGDQSNVSNFEAKYPILTSLNPLGQPTIILFVEIFFIYLYLDK